MFATNLDVGHVQLQLHDEATTEQYGELGLFVRDCIDRVERQLGRAGSWKIQIIPDRVCFHCAVSVQYGSTIIDAKGAGFDGAVAGWQAFREIENQLREHIGTDVTRANIGADATSRVA